MSFMIVGISEERLGQRCKKREVIYHAKLPSLSVLYYIPGDMMKKMTQQGSNGEKLIQKGLFYENIDYLSLRVFYKIFVF